MTVSQLNSHFKLRQEVKRVYCLNEKELIAGIIIQSSISVTNKSDKTNKPETNCTNAETEVNNHFQTNAEVSLKNVSNRQT